jgi:hypothetical protein
MEEDSFIHPLGDSNVAMIAEPGTLFTICLVDQMEDTTRPSLPDSVTTRSSLLDNPRHVLTCRTFVLSGRSSGCFSESQLVVGQLDSSRIHVWNTVFDSKD